MTLHGRPIPAGRRAWSPPSLLCERSHVNRGTVYIIRVISLPMRTGWSSAREIVHAHERKTPPEWARDIRAIAGGALRAAGIT